MTTGFALCFVRWFLAAIFFLIYVQIPGFRPGTVSMESADTKYVNGYPKSTEKCYWKNVTNNMFLTVGPDNQYSLTSIHVLFPSAGGD